MFYGNIKKLNDIWKSFFPFISSPLLRGREQVNTEIPSDNKIIDEQQLTWQCLTDNLKSIVFIFNQEGRYIYVNPFMEMLTGFAASELKESFFYEIVHPDHQQLVKERGYARLKGGDMPSNYELKIKTKEGNVKWVELSVSLINIKGEALGFGTGLDITDKKFAEKQLKVERAYLENLFDNSPEAIVVTSNQGIVRSINKEFTRLFGFTEEEVIGHSIDSLIAPENQLTEAKNETDTVARGYRISTEAVRRKKDGTLINVSILGAPIEVDDEQIAVYGIYRDITRRIQYQKEMEDARRKAEEADRLKSSFLANMSHEIRTPMNAIIGFSRLLKDPNIHPEQLYEYVNIINGRANHLLQIINDIIDLSKIESGELRVSEDVFNLNHFLDEIYSVTLNELEQACNKEINLFLNKGLKDDEANIVADKTRLQQILHNLLSNAVKYTQKGYIKFGYKLLNGKGRKLEFYVCDTGIGIKEEKQKIIFDRFRQSDESKTREFGGTGLGLSISKGLVENMNGEMWVNSQYGKGSVFSFTIPLKSTDVKDKIVTLHDNNYSTMAYNWENIQILVVEDDILSSKFLEAVLEETGAKIIFTKDGNQAIETVKKNNVDVVLMDIQLPGMSGNKTTRKIKEFDKNIPVIAQTAHAMPEDKNISMEAGCDDYITKPIDINMLLDKIEALLKKFKKISSQK
ncbi:MAG: PAS domain S-box protein [Bacteroidales bacterium]